MTDWWFDNVFMPVMLFLLTVCVLVMIWVMGAGIHRLIWPPAQECQQVGVTLKDGRRGRVEVCFDR